MVGAALVGLVAGCSSSEDSAKDNSKVAVTSAPPNEGGTGSTGGSGDASVPPVTGVIERYEGGRGEGLAKTITTDECGDQPGLVRASGKVRMPEGGKAGDVVISVGWSNYETGTVVAAKVVTVEGVTADKDSEWSTEVDLPDNGFKVRCSVGGFVKG